MNYFLIICIQIKISYIFRFILAKKKECEQYNLTTTAEFSSSDEDEPARRQRKRKTYDDFVTGLYTVKV